MKYKKGEKLESIGAVYEHLYGGGVVIKETTVMHYLYEIDDDILYLNIGCSDGSFDAREKCTHLVIKNGEFFKYIEEKEPLKMPEFFKVYYNKNTGTKVILTSKRKDGLIITSDDAYTLKDFWETFEEDTK